MEVKHLELLGIYPLLDFLERSAQQMLFPFFVPNRFQVEASEFPAAALPPSMSTQALPSLGIRTSTRSIPLDSLPTCSLCKSPETPFISADNSAPSGNNCGLTWQRSMPQQARSLHGIQIPTGVSAPLFTHRFYHVVPGPDV